MRRYRSGQSEELSVTIVEKVIDLECKIIFRNTARTGERRVIVSGLSERRDKRGRCARGISWSEREGTRVLQKRQDGVVAYCTP